LSIDRGDVRSLEPSCLVAVCSLDEARKQRMWLQRLRPELGLKLHRQDPRMRGQLGDLDELAVRRAARHAHAFLEQRRLVQTVELESVTMAFVHERGAIHAFGDRSWRQLAGIASQTHGAAKLVDAEQ